MPETPTPPQEAPARKLNLRRLERLQRLLQYGAALVLLVFVVLIVVASVQLRSITNRVQSARQTEREFQTNINALAAQSENLRAQVSQKQAEVERGADALFNIRSKSDEAKALVDEAVKEASEKSAAAPAQLTPLVYIQIERADQMAKAREVAGQLKAKGYNVPGIENVGEKPPRESEVRYCDGDASARDLADIGGLLSAAGVTLRRRNLGAMCGRIRARQYELWFFDDFPPGRAPAEPPASATPAPGPARDPAANRRPREPERPRRPTP